MHIDLLKVRLDEKIQTTVPLELEGVEDAPGVKEGGVLEHVTRELNVEALPTDIPDRIVADVSGLGIAETMMLSSVTPPPGVELLDDLEETVVATVTAPSRVEEPEAEIEEEAELVGEGEVPGGRGGRRGGRRGGLLRGRRRGLGSSLRLFRGRGRALRSTSCSSASATRGRATPAPATTSASRSRTCSPQRWELPRARKQFGGLRHRRPHRARACRASRCCCPQTYMNESGRAVGPARGQYKLDLDQLVVVHDEIDLPFGEVRARKGGGVAGHNGLKSVKQGVGGNDFWRVRVGVGRPDSTDPEIVSAHVLSRFTESPGEVRRADRARRGRDGAPARARIRSTR